MDYLDNLDAQVLDELEKDIADQLFQDWLNAQANEGDDYAEHEMMHFASPALRQGYNKFYKYEPEDDYYLA